VQVPTCCINRIICLVKNLCSHMLPFCVACIL
jgi:hypothetical protein